MLERWRRGVDVAYGVCDERAGETAFKRWTAKAFYRLLNRVVDITIPLDTGDFRLMDRRVAEIDRPAHGVSEGRDERYRCTDEDRGPERMRGAPASPAERRSRSPCSPWGWPSSSAPPGEAAAQGVCASGAPTPGTRIICRCVLRTCRCGTPSA